MAQAATIRHRTFHYVDSIEWTHGKSGDLTCEGKPDLHVSTPREFGGEADRWSAQDLFVASVQICIMTSFIGLTAKHKIAVKSFRAAARGALDFIDGGWKFSKIQIDAEATVVGADNEVSARNLMLQAEQGCVISRSINCSVEINPSIASVPDEPEAD